MSSRRPVPSYEQHLSTNNAGNRNHHDDEEFHHQVGGNNQHMTSAQLKNDDAGNHFHRDEKGFYPDRQHNMDAVPFLCVAVLGTSAQLKNDVGNQILHDEQAFCTDRNQLMQSRNQKFHVVNTADFFDEYCKHPDQQIIDFMAVSHPGPDLFILVVDPAEATEEKVVAQITKLGEIFGDSMWGYLVVLLRDAQSYRSLRHLMDQFKITVAVQKENLASDCQRWCCDRSTFCYEYSLYSEMIVTRRKETLANKNYHTALNKAKTQQEMLANEGIRGLPPQAHAGAKVTECILVLLGLTGSGKSASGNTILKAGGSKLSFRSETSSVPVTRQCQVQVTNFGIPVKVVDTPDFFSDQLPNAQQQLAQCREYCQSDHCIILLVFQLGRFSEAEVGLVTRFENALRIRIRHRTIILFTHAEDLEGELGDYFIKHEQLMNIIQQCGNCYQLFNNNSKDVKQVKQLLKKILPTNISIGGKKNDCFLS